MSITNLKELFHLDRLQSEVLETTLVAVFFLVTFGAFCLLVKATVWSATKSYQRLTKGPRAMNAATKVATIPGKSSKPVAPIETVAAAKPSPHVRSYALVQRLGSGDVCEVFRGRKNDDEYVVKMPRALIGTGLLAKESVVLEQLLDTAREDSYRNYFPLPTDSFEVDRRRVNVFAWRDGFYTAEQIRKHYPNGLDGRHIAWMFKRTLEALGFAHNNNWIHGAVLPPHLLFHAENHGLQLIDWIHAERPSRALSLVPAKFTQWYPPECVAKQPVTPSIDIFLAARSMIWLAGGDPVSSEIPDHLPEKMRLFLSGCLLESPTMRCHDAWQLHEEFTELLEGVYGAPAYHRLEMS